ncbi:retropepsin-like aspartic protease [Flavobacterium sp.]|uniref:retropepsin-like aspartic protease family protein n=1 Tax=Flavobacterium sp. TaxID=239 RepID=UPI001B575A96|nr:retropepsin-like aspartic protease [Flavobacterium sp.]MBP6182919.1 retroviral-like aspartic protease family protein [Flavobacterium sp.]
MKKIFFIFILFSGCKHPESDSFDRFNNKKIDNQTNVDNNSSFLKKNKVQEETNVIKMESENGVKYVWVEINDLKLRFIFDTGASSICISPAEATVLYRQGTLKREDILDVEYFQDATGKISEGTKINLRTVKVGNIILENIDATVIDNINAPLLLGQTVFEKFGNIEIDNINNEIILK